MSIVRGGVGSIITGKAILHFVDSADRRRLDVLVRL